jgi:hypothetical protein
VARADKNVTSFPYQSIGRMVGEDPTRCPAGHEYKYLPWAAR